MNNKETDVNAPGKGLLRVSGILLLAFGSIIIISAVIELLLQRGNLLFNFLIAVIYVTAGIFGIKYSGRTDKARLLKYIAIISIAAIVVLSFLFVFNIVYGLVELDAEALLINLRVGLIFAAIGSILPVLYLIGAQKNLKGVSQ